MEIGGYDIILNTTNISELIEVVTSSWPDLESDSEGNSFFVFMDEGYLKSYLEFGITPENSHGILQFIVGEDTTTLVCDDKDDPVVRELVHYAEPFYDSYPK